MWILGGSIDKKILKPIQHKFLDSVKKKIICQHTVSLNASSTLNWPCTVRSYNSCKTFHVDRGESLKWLVKRAGPKQLNDGYSQSISWQHPIALRDDLFIHIVCVDGGIIRLNVSNILVYDQLTNTVNSSDCPVGSFKVSKSSQWTAFTYFYKSNIIKLAQNEGLHNDTT